MFSQSPEGAILVVRAAPRSSKSGIDGLFGDALRVRIRCAPVDGKANKELIETLADVFSLPKSKVKLVGGTTSKNKRVLLEGLSVEEARKAINV
ncbi:MAG: DUF167 domain-containing protein [Kiritimatiellae bacterium]|nr:DUF167 domain-containing protein [Kiritimatiellia bacterium]